MSQSLADPTVLVQVNAKDTGDVSRALVDLLSPHQLVVLGYYPVPDQTSADQARAQFGAEATEVVEGIADRFAERGARVESTVVFTHDRDRTVDNVAAEYEVDAVLTAGPVGEELDRILVPLRGDDNLDRILGFLGGLLRDSHATATLFNVVESDDEASRGELLVRGACDRLTDEEGIDRDRVDWRVERDASPSAAIATAAAEYDLLIVGESEPSLTDRILGKVTDKVIDRSADPLLIVRNK